MKFHKLQEFMFDLFIMFSWGILVLIILGVFHGKPAYFHYIEAFVKIYIGIFLMIRYNPFKIRWMNFKFSELDRKIIFSAGLIILSSSLFKEYLEIFYSNSSISKANINTILQENNELIDDKYVLF
jgi:hypothetical protein